MATRFEHCNCFNYLDLVAKKQQLTTTEIVLFETYEAAYILNTQQLPKSVETVMAASQALTQMGLLIDTASQERDYSHDT